MNTGTKKEYNSYLVTDEELLYRLASCSLLDKLCGVAPSKYVEGTHVWFFDKDPGVWNVIRQYNAEKRAKLDDADPASLNKGRRENRVLDGSDTL